jgi:hypothetical protein
VLDVSQSRVCQLHSQAINRLRGSLGDLLGTARADAPEAAAPPARKPAPPSAAARPKVARAMS